MVLATSLSAALTQTPTRVFGDGQQYQRMAQQFSTGFTGVSVDAPFVYRIATPWLAARTDAVVTPALPEWLDLLIDNASGLDGVPGFYAVNIIASFAATMLLVSYLRCFIASAGIRLVLVSYWIVQWHTPVRYSYFNPVNVEPVFVVCVLTSLLLIERSRGWSHERGAYAVAAIVFAGTLVRESMIVIPIAFAALHYQRWKSTSRPAIDLAPALFPLVAWLLAMVCTTQYVGVPFHPTDPSAVPLEMLRTKSPRSWILAWFFTFGPVALALVLSRIRNQVSFLTGRPYLAVYLVACSALAFVGGTDTERLLGWTFPVMLVLIGRALEGHWSALRRWPLVAAALVASTLVSARIFWPIPAGPEEQLSMHSVGLNWASAFSILDKVFVIENYYANLWSYYGSPSIHTAVLLADVALVMMLIVFLTRVSPIKTA